MKTIIRILLAVSASFFLISCEKETAATPKALMTVNKNQFDLNESMIINFTGSADQVVIYTGGESHEYDLREQSNTGFVVNKGIFSHAYSSPGTYKVVCVASTYTDEATELKRDTCSVIVTVIDDQTEIERLSCPQVLYDEVFAQKLANDEWLMLLPRKVKYNQATPSISLSQKLKFYIQSDSTAVYINGVKYLNTAKYDLSSTAKIKVVSNYGTIRPYKLHTLYYPEFSTFKLLGVEGKLVRNEYDYSSFEVQVTLPVGTDVSNLTPEFTLFSPTDKVYIGETEQLSGTSEVNFTNNVTYRLISTLSENSELQAASTIKITINYK